MDTKPKMLPSQPRRLQEWQLMALLACAVVFLTLMAYWWLGAPMECSLYKTISQNL